MKPIDERLRGLSDDLGRAFGKTPEERDRKAAENETKMEQARNRHNDFMDEVRRRRNQL